MYNLQELHSWVDHTANFNDQIWIAIGPEGGWTDEWCGDSWKTIPYLIKNNLDLNISVLNTDYGLGIITKRDNPNNKYQISNDLNYYKNLTYCDLDANHKEMLNLIELNELNNLIKDIF